MLALCPLLRNNSTSSIKYHFKGNDSVLNISQKKGVFLKRHIKVNTTSVLRFSTAISLDGRLVKICERLPADIHGVDLSIHEHPLGKGNRVLQKILIVPDIFNALIERKECGTHNSLN